VIPRALTLALLLTACRSSPPFAPARFVEPQECAADADCGAGRICMPHDSFVGAISHHCVVPCSAANRTCPAGHVAPYCAPETFVFVDAGGRGFPGATGWDEAFWADAGP
jgi:Cys-rich repeat protein